MSKDILPKVPSHSGDITILISVINDICFDRRIDRIASTLAEAGFKVAVIGVEREDSPPLPHNKPYTTFRIKTLFKKGKLFYFEVNLRLFLWLLKSRRYHIYSSADIDTGLPMWLTARLKKSYYFLDLHEIFSELPSVIHRPLTRYVWRTIEKFLLARADKAYTISSHYAMFYHLPEECVVRNVPEKSLRENPDISKRNYILYRGSVNVGRAFEQVVMAFHKIDMPLWICGGGDYTQQLISIIHREGLSHKILLKGWIPPPQLEELTWNARAGITIFEPSGLSNYYSLANRFFDYINNLVPQVAFNYPEYRKIVEKYRVAILIDDLTPSTIARAINLLIRDNDLYSYMVEECKKAREEFCWEREKEKLLKIYTSVR